MEKGRSLDADHRHRLSLVLLCSASTLRCAVLCKCCIAWLMHASRDVLE